MTRVRLPVAPTVRDPLAPDARLELTTLGSRLVVPVGTCPTGPGPHETLRAHLFVDRRPGERIRQRLHLRALRGVLTIDVATVPELIALLEAAQARAAAIRRAAA